MFEKEVLPASIYVVALWTESCSIGKWFSSYAYGG